MGMAILAGWQLFPLHDDEVMVFPQNFRWGLGVQYPKEYRLL
jgi:hypothetical protein